MTTKKISDMLSTLWNRMTTRHDGRMRELSERERLRHAMDAFGDALTLAGRQKAVIWSLAKAMPDNELVKAAMAEANKIEEDFVRGHS